MSITLEEAIKTYPGGVVELARAAGLPRSTVYDMMTGRGFPRWDTAMKVLEQLEDFHEEKVGIYWLREEMRKRPPRR